MPKKQPKGAFYFFMLDFKEEQRKNGVHYQNLAEVMGPAGSAWAKAPPSVRAEYEAKAKAEKQKNSVPEKKFTSTGRSLAELEREEKELEEAALAENNNINKLVKQKAFNGTLLDEIFFIMDVNAYCTFGSNYIIGEFTLLTFNIRDGILDNYHEFVNPGKIPVGYAYDAKLGAEEFALDTPDMDNKSNFTTILATLIDFLTQKNHTMKVFPPIFTMPEKIAQIQSFLMQMCNNTGEDYLLFSVYHLDKLFFTLINEVKSKPTEGFPKPSLALLQLQKDPFKYSPGLACPRHDEMDKTGECSTARCKRWAITMLDFCCPLAGVDLVPGKHVPADFDMETIYACKAKLLQPPPPRAPPAAGPSSAVRHAKSTASSHNSTLNESYHSATSKLNRSYDVSEDASTLDRTSESAASNTSKKTRVHIPLRPPKMVFGLSMTQRGSDESASDAPSEGTGRGRGLARRLRDMNIE